MRHYSILLGVLLILMQAPLFAADKMEVGLKVGDKVPYFKVADQTGKKQSFKDICGKNGLIFIFHRSANW